MRFNENRCRLLHLGRNNHMHWYRLEAELREETSMEKDLHILMDNKLVISQHCASVDRKANGILGCIKKNVASTSREVILSLYSALARPHLDSVSSFGLPSSKENRQLLESPAESYKDDYRPGASPL